MKTENLTEQEKAAVVFYFKLELLRAKGFVEGGCRLSPKGLALADQLVAEGVVLDDAFTASMIDVSLGDETAAHKEAVFLLIKDLDTVSEG